MQPAEPFLSDFYFWMSMLFILSGVVAYVAGFLTCFFFCNYAVVRKEGGE